MYYTDPGALFFVLLSYYFAQIGRNSRIRYGPMTKLNLFAFLVSDLLYF